MSISHAGLTLIERYEGFSAHVYVCPAGLRTIGFGHVIRPQENFDVPISMHEAKALLAQDVIDAENAVIRFIQRTLSQYQFDALVSFTFNVGAAALQRSTLRQVVNRGEHAQVPVQLMRWVRASGRILPGLIARRQDEARLYLS